MRIERFCGQAQVQPRVAGARLVVAALVTAPMAAPATALMAAPMAALMVAQDWAPLAEPMLFQLAHASDPAQAPAVTAGPVAAHDAPGTRSPGADPLAAIPAPQGAADGEVVVAYYCHVTLRCETCLTAERLIADLLRTDFAGQLEHKSLVWHPLDYEQPENAAYAAAFGLEGGPAFVLGRWRTRRLVEWHNVVEIWDHSEDSIGLVEVARERLRLFLQAEKWRASMDSTRAANAAPSAPSSSGSGTATGEQKGR